MKVLFLGEYSGAFLEIAQGLNKLGISTYRVSDGDSYKQIPADFIIPQPDKCCRLITYLRIYTKMFGVFRLFTFIKIWPELKKKIQGFDVVQINNPRFLPFGDLINFFIVRYVYNHNKRIYLSVLGDDYYVDRWYFKNDNKMPWYKFNKKTIQRREKYFLKFITDYIIEKSTAIIAPTWVYKSAYDWTGKTTRVIPFACDENKIGNPIKLGVNEPIKIFNAWQKGKEMRKGNEVFDKVVKKVVEKYGDKVNYQVVQNVPFDVYMDLFKDCHIYIDQLYAHDKATSGMYGMAAGKVVFAGFEEEALSVYPVYNKEEIGVPSSMDENILFDQFCYLVENPERLEVISKNAINFIKSNHSSLIVAKMYLGVWNSK